MWKDFDEELYQALLLEQRLSSEGPRLLTCPQPSSFHCKLSEIRIMSSQMEWAFIKLRGRGHVGDPLHPVTIIMLALWIPVNIIYLGFQALKHLLATRAVIEPLHDGTVRALPAGLEVSSLYVT